MLTIQELEADEAALTAQHEMLMAQTNAVGGALKYIQDKIAVLKQRESGAKDETPTDSPDTCA